MKPSYEVCTKYWIDLVKYFMKYILDYTVIFKILARDTAS